MVTMNGSVVGTIQNLSNSVGMSGLSVGLVKNMGDPSDIVTAPIGSLICMDVVNNELYIAETQLGSSWIHLTSGA